MDILIIVTISKFSETKQLTQKRPPNVSKNLKMYKEALNQKVSEKRPPKWDILILHTISKFSKTKNLTKKRPPKVPKNQKPL